MRSSLFLWQFSVPLQSDSFPGFGMIPCVDFLRERHAYPEVTQPLARDRRTFSPPLRGKPSSIEASPSVMLARSFGRRQSPS
jgi:hypothetical protein